ncbi:MAG: SDR family NAD(P)-dependent oxidoreductase [Bacteroidia bacterium]|nr:SDR family NAD(P)-dependent oxidoreductase [Bacteroidia bacterium]MCZ2277164.1 SDR family NAD(P)-dependent oxidoreductase [Bacteroidia bacterium]
MSIILITGVSSGIGKATAIKFAQQGWDVIITARRKDRLHQIASEIKSVTGSSALPLDFDVQNRNETEQRLNSIPENWKSIDVLLNNAGLARGISAIQDGDIEDWETMIDTNIKGLLYVSKVIMPWMIERKKGHIINLSSVAGKEVYPGGNVYCATKHAVDAINKAMRMDLLEYGIKVTSVNPGMTDTEFSLVRFKGDSGRAHRAYSGYEPLHADDVAEVIYFAATRPSHVCLNEIILTPTAQANAILPIKRTL